MNEILLSLIQTLTIILAYYFISLRIIKKTKIEISFFNFLFIYHLAFCLVYFIYSYFEISDAKSIHYLALVTEFNNFIEQEKANIDLEIGQPFMILFLRYIIYPFQLTFFSGTVLFGMMSFTGMLILYWIMRNSIYDENKLDIILIKSFFFFPSLHFWQMSMSKDALIFLCIALFILFQKNLIKYYYFGILSLTIIFLIRPYLIPFLIFFTYLNFLLDKKIARGIKIFFSLLSIVPIFFIFQKSIAYVGINLYEFNINNPYLLFEEIKIIISESRTVALMQNAGIDKSNLNFFYQVFVYLFGPFNIFDNNLLYKIATIENLILIFYIAILVYNKNFKSIDLFRTTTLLIFLSLLIILSIRTSNYGINMRQKWMILPFLIIFLSNFTKKSKSN